MTVMDEPWGKGKVWRLVEGRSLPSVEGGLRDTELESWFQLRSGAYDHGDPELICDVVQFEAAVGSIDDLKVRAAMVLRSWGFENADIGALLGRRGDPRTGLDLVREGVKSVIAYEQQR